MSPFLATLGTMEKGFPRVSGDEPPSAQVTHIAVLFSPRERG